MLLCHILNYYKLLTLIVLFDRNKEKSRSHQRKANRVRPGLQGKDGRSKTEIVGVAAASGEERVKRRTDGEAVSDSSESNKPQQDEVAPSVVSQPQLPQPQPPPVEDPAVKFAKRNVGDSVDDARARYLARKQNRQVPISSSTD